MIDVVAFIQVEGAGELLDVHHVWHIVVTEAQDGERPAGRRMPAPAEGHYLNGDVAQAGDLDERVPLAPHDCLATTGAAQRPLVEDRPPLRRPGAGEQVL